METLGERPIWSMSDGELLSDLDGLDAELARLQTRRLHVVAHIDETGYAEQLGARDTVELLAFRYRLDRAEALRDVRLARALSRYNSVSTGLVDGIPIPPPQSEKGSADSDAADRSVADYDTTEDGVDGAVKGDGVRGDDQGNGAEDGDTVGDGVGGGAEDDGIRGDGQGSDAEGGDMMGDRVSGSDDGDTAGDGVGAGAEDGDTGGSGVSNGVGGVRLLRPVQAGVIVSALERVRSRVPVEDLDVAEKQLVALAAHLSPGELRSAAKQICDLLDSDGPEPDEHKAYARESLTLLTAENGVKFRGFLANENAELLRSVVHAGARPHKTTDGELDPRPRDKRQADALTTALTIAAKAADTGFTRTNLHPQPRTTPSARPPATTPAGAPEAQSAGASAATSSAGAFAASSAGAPEAQSAGPSAATTSAGAPGRNLSEPAAVSGVSADGDAVRDSLVGDVRGGGDPERWVPGFGAKANITVTIDLEDLKRATADATGDLVYGDGLSAAAIRRLACDAKIIPLVLGSKSEPLDVGRAERLVTRAMRRALNTRDKGCVVCGAPPIQCDAHHLISWIDGGETKVSNLVLLCRRHHIDLHAGHWTISITNGEVHVSRPTWADPPPLHTLHPIPPPAAPNTETHPATTTRPSAANPGRHQSGFSAEPPGENPWRADTSGENSWCANSRGMHSSDEELWAEQLSAGGADTARPRTRESGRRADAPAEPDRGLSGVGAESSDENRWPADTPGEDSWDGDSRDAPSSGDEPSADQPSEGGADATEPRTPASGFRRAEAPAERRVRVRDCSAEEASERRVRDGDRWAEESDERGACDDNCWAGEAAEKTRESGPWADDATRQEAARFALWGETSASATGKCEAPRGSVGSGPATELDPWGDDVRSGRSAAAAEQPSHSSNDAMHAVT